MREWQYQPHVAPTPNYRAVKYRLMTNNPDADPEMAPTRPTTGMQDPFVELAEMERVEREGGHEADKAATHDIVEETDQHQFCKPYNCHQSDYPDMGEMDPPESLDAPDIEVTGAEDVGMEIEGMMDGLEDD